MRIDITNCENWLNIPKYPELPDSPRAMPVFEKIPMAVVKVVSISKLLKESRTHPHSNVRKYSSVCIEIEDATFDETGVVSSSITAFTMLGWICLKTPLFINLNSTKNLNTFKEPDVEYEQPPMKRSRMSIVMANEGQVV